MASEERGRHVLGHSRWHRRQLADVRNERSCIGGTTREIVNGTSRKQRLARPDGDTL